MADQKKINETIRTTVSITCMLVMLASCTNEVVPEATPVIDEIHTSAPPVNVTTREQGKGRQRTYSDNDFINQFQFRPAREYANPWSLTPPVDYRQHQKNYMWPTRPGKLQYKNPWLQPESAASGTGWNSPYPSAFENTSNPWGSGSDPGQNRQQKDGTVWAQTEDRNSGWEEFSVDGSFWSNVPNSGLPESDDSGSIW